MNKILQFKITLKNTEPKIWRRFLVPENINFYELHLIIQNIMGWYNSHLYQFVYNNNMNLIGDPELLEQEDVMDAKKFHVKDYFNEQKKKIEYEYDFGDGWTHELIFEKAIEEEYGKYYPVCLEGEGNCPPEDCGGVGGFDNLVEAMKKKKGKEYKEYKEWLGEDYNSAEFDLEYINESLKTYKSVDWSD